MVATHGQVECATFVYLQSGPLPEAQRSSVRGLWLHLVAVFGKAVPLPRVEVSGERFRYSWSRRDRFLDVELFPDGRCEWFMSVDGAAPQGTASNQEAIDLEGLATLLATHFTNERSSRTNQA